MCKIILFVTHFNDYDLVLYLMNLIFLLYLMDESFIRKNQMFEKNYCAQSADLGTNLNRRKTGIVVLWDSSPTAIK